jgi:UDP-N-acetylglucosamine 2-epimerase (non-hydrolysing)
MSRKICIVVGTRPEIIKMSPVIRYCADNNLDFFIIHSNQHYSENMDKIFFRELNLPEPKYSLMVGSSSHGNQTANILIKIEDILMKEKPDVVLVEGDTNTVLAGALGAAKLHIKVGHVEAGLRSYNRKMPEETNRVVTDHVSDYLFAPTKIQEDILAHEGIEKEKVFVVGNTIADAISQNIRIAEENSKIMTSLNLSKGKYFLITAHRALNVDIKENLEILLKIIQAISKKYKERMIYPMHPRTKKMIDQYGLNDYLSGITVVEPLGYFDFLVLQRNARLILTDSGGIQEEACILGVPCITLREETERPETVDAGANIITGLDQKKVIESVENMLKKLSKKEKWKNPYGDGNSSEKIIRILLDDK